VVLVPFDYPALSTFNPSSALKSSPMGNLAETRSVPVFKRFWSGGSSLEDPESPGLLRGGLAIRQARFLAQRWQW
jgi:hypothetical protein